MYDPAADSWTTIQHMNTKRDGPGVASAPCTAPSTGTCIYAFGGVDENNSYLNSIEQYDPTTKTWTTITGANATMGTARLNAGAASGPCQGNTSATCIYAVAGLNAALFLKSAEMYDPSTGTWTALPDTNQFRDSLAGASGPCQGTPSATCIYAVGGIISTASTPTRPMPTGLVEMYDPSANSWTAVNSLTTERDFPGAANGPCEGTPSATCIYAIGGIPRTGSIQSSVEMFDPSANTWTLIDSMNTARDDMGAASGPCRTPFNSATCLYAIGGVDGILSTVESSLLTNPSVTMALARSFAVVRTGATVRFRWTVARPGGIAGFNLYAGPPGRQGRRINHALIPVHASSSRYQYLTRQTTAGPYRLTAMTTGGSQVVVATAGS
jgi:hypothetical protein